VRRAIFRGRVFFQQNEQLVIILAFRVSVFLRLCCGFGGRLKDRMATREEGSE
jgi:hypothetical protein